MTRRDLISACAAAGAAMGTVFGLKGQAAAPAPAPNGPFTLPALDYPYDALEPYIDAQTMQIHHDKHHKAYVDNLNKAVVNYPELQKMTPDQLMANLPNTPEAVRTAIRNQGGGHANHSLFWKTLAKSSGSTTPKGELAADINKTFGGVPALQDKLSAAAIGTFGSGWGWLVLDQGNLKVISLPNQDSPITGGAHPVMGIDVWEHAYYLKYKNKRPDYIKAYFSVVNWDAVSAKYAAQSKA